MAIYTKKGDKGETGIFGGKRISKGSLEIEALGAVDEANSFLGLTISFLDEQYLKNKITQVQRDLFKLGSIIAGAKLSIPKSVVKKYEKEIDEWTALMPPLTHFIFPGGSKPAGFLFTARTTVRRAERAIVNLSKEKKISPNVLVYINRLSDYLFTLARYINFRQGIRENIWKSSK
jgi:cob(I)alamin adenosyltransferase